MSSRTIRILSWGGVGDVLLTTPALAAIKKKNPSRKVIVYSKNPTHKMVLDNNPHVDGLRRPNRWAKLEVGIIRLFRLDTFYIPNYGQFLPGLFCNKKAAALIAEQIFNVETGDGKVEIYLTPQEEARAKEILAPYRNPIVLHVIPRGSSNKMWPFGNWEALVRAMPDHTFLQIGQPDEKQVAAAIDLRGKISFREALALIKYASSFVGVDSSFAHATNAFDVPGVVLFGATTPDIWGHENNLNLYKKLRCSPCIDLLYDSRCPYNQLCMAEITVDEVRNALLQQMQTKIKHTKTIQYEN